MSEGKKEILLGDCLELMKDIPNGSIDMILCDLPYGTTACKWDTIIPFDKLWEQYERIIKPNGAIVLTASQPFTSALVMSNPKLFKYSLVWIKNIPTGFWNAKKMQMKIHEDICLFYKSTPKYNPQMVKRTEEEYRKCLRVNDSKSNAGESFGGKDKLLIRKTKEEQWYKYPTTEIKIPLEDYRNGKGHPTQKPVALFEYLIKTYTNEGDLVLDNCAGSGTTAIACLNTNRQFIVMEKEEKYYDIILKRVGDFNKKFETQTLFGNEM
jgi:site-specific DNA-methyltransferase (adenine-specific)